VRIVNLDYLGECGLTWVGGSGRSTVMTNEEHRIRWFVRSGDGFVPHEGGMRGSWGYEARCSCGWDSRTGGALRSYVEGLVRDHKRFYLVG
jgi:hypothetical protein